MANFWENDPIVGQASAAKASPSLASGATGKPASPRPLPALPQTAIPLRGSPGKMTAPAGMSPNLEMNGRPVPVPPNMQPPAEAGGNFWEADPVVAVAGKTTAPSGPSAQERYDAALERVRQLQFADMPEDKWREYALGEGRTGLIGDLGRIPGAFEPYGVPELVQHGTLFGFTDELAAGKAALGAGFGKLFGGQGPDMGEVWQARLELEQAKRDLGREKSGAGGMAAEVFGGLGSGGALMKPVQAAAAAPTVLNTAKTAAGLTVPGAVYGFGSTDGGLEERGMGAATGAAVSAAAGAVAPLVVRGGQRVVQGMRQGALNKAAIAKAPTAATIKAGSRASYRASEATGAVVDQGALNILGQDMRARLLSEGVLLPKTGAFMGGYPKAKSAFKALRQYINQGSLSMKEAQTLNRMIRKVAMSNDAGEQRLGQVMLEEFDNFFDSLPPQAFSRGNGQEALKHWGSAKSEWARFKRTSAIESAIYKARFAKGGFADGLRSEFASILKSPKRRIGFTAQEIKAMEDFAEGGPLQSFLEFIQGGGTIGSALAGHAMGGPAAGAALAAGKMAGARMASGALDRGARNTAQLLRAQVALPGGVPQLPLPKVIDGVARRIGVGAGNPMLEEMRNGVPDLMPKPLYIGGR